MWTYCSIYEEKGISVVGKELWITIDIPVDNVDKFEITRKISTQSVYKFVDCVNMSEYFLSKEKTVHCGLF